MTDIYEPRWAKWLAWSVTVSGLILAGLVLSGVLFTGCSPRSRDLPSLQSR